MDIFASLLKIEDPIRSRAATINVKLTDSVYSDYSKTRKINNKSLNPNDEVGEQKSKQTKKMLNEHQVMF